MTVYSTVDRDVFDKSEDSSWNLLKWVPTSNAKQAQAEDKILQRCKCSLEKFFLPIYNSTFSLRTIIARNFPQSEGTVCEENVPLLLIHGFASGIGLWCKNIDSLSANRRVYAFDLLGFGRSSRPPFPENPEEVEDIFVDVIEEFCKVMKLDKIILGGHSMGGFLVSAYAIKHPERVVHLILIDPWGFVGRDKSTQGVPPGFRGWLANKLSTFRALATMRMIGPLGLNALRKVRGDIGQIYSQTPERNEDSDSIVANPWGAEDNKNNKIKPTDSGKGSGIEKISPYDPEVVYNYIYHINCRHPTGEDAFRSMSDLLGWAARPMLPRIAQVAPDLPITFIYGGRSWADMSSGLRARTLRPQSYVDVMVIEGGGHHAYAQYADEFNDYVNIIARLVDEGHVFRPGSEEVVQAKVAAAAAENQQNSQV